MTLANAPGPGENGMTSKNARAARSAGGSEWNPR
jgi:hypothetical protein